MQKMMDDTDQIIAGINYRISQRREEVLQQLNQLKKPKKRKSSRKRV